MAVTSWLKGFAPSQVCYARVQQQNRKFWFGCSISHCADNGFIFDKTYSSLVRTDMQMILPNIAHAHCPESRIFAYLDLFGLLGAFK